MSSARAREVLNRLLRAGTVVASTDGSRHEVFPVAIGASEGAALQRWVEHERAAHDSWNAPPTLGTSRSTRTRAPGSPIAGFRCWRRRASPRWSRRCRWSRRLVRRGGIVFVDDYQLPSVSRAVSFCVTNLGWAHEEVSQEDDLHSWVVLRTPRSPDRRPFDRFVDF